LTDAKAAPPPNIAEFNLIVGLIFAQLYEAFPVLVPIIDREAIAKIMGVEPGAWAAHKLPSGRSFSEVLAHTMSWLAAQNYIIAAGSHPAERVTLTDKGLSALNAMPSGLGGTVGQELVKASSEPSRRDWAQLGELVGGMFAGAAKGLAGS
jgi:hypothetical protein